MSALRPRADIAATDRNGARWSIPGIRPRKMDDVDRPRHGQNRGSMRRIRGTGHHRLLNSGSAVNHPPGTPQCKELQWHPQRSDSLYLSDRLASLSYSNHLGGPLHQAEPHLVGDHLHQVGQHSDRSGIACLGQRTAIGNLLRSSSDWQSANCTAILKAPVSNRLCPAAASTRHAPSDGQTDRSLSPGNPAA